MTYADDVADARRAGVSVAEHRKRYVEKSAMAEARYAAKLQLRSANRKAGCPRREKQELQLC